MRNAGFCALFVAVLAIGSSAWPSGQVVQGGGRGAAPPAGGPGAQPPLVGTGFIAGQVVEVPSGKPVPEAVVTMSGRLAVAGRAQGNANQVVADAQGRFFFGSLPVGTYSLSTGKAYYVSPPTSPGVAIELTDGERVVDARLRLMKVASVSGALRDVVGDPVVGTDVLVVRRAIVNGRQALQVAGKTRSDDRGIYRAGNLSPGDYVVCACSRDPIPLDSTLLTTLGSDPVQLMNLATRALSGGSDVVSLDNTLRTYPPMFHQNSATLARATKITLAPGDDKTGVDMNLEAVRATRVSGAIVGAPGPVQAQSMRLVPAADGDISADLFSLPPILAQADGRFDFAMVPPGQYRLLVVYRDAGGRGGGPSGAALGLVGAQGVAPPAAATMSGGPPASDVPPMWANEPITVGETGVTGLSVVLNRALVVTGRVQWIGGAPQPPAQMLQRATVTLQPVSLSDPMAAIGGTAVGRFSPDASFTVPGAIPGKYILNSNALPGFPTLKSVFVAGLDMTDLVFEIADKDVGDVVVTYVDTPMATLTVTTNALAGSMPFDDTWAIVFPADRKYWTEPAAARRRFRSGVVTNHGISVNADLPAGEYLVVITTGPEAQDWQEATKLDALSRRAQRITVNDGDHKSIEVRR